jgi:hypothetical protein
VEIQCCGAAQDGFGNRSSPDADHADGIADDLSAGDVLKFAGYGNATFRGGYISTFERALRLVVRGVQRGHWDAHMGVVRAHEFFQEPQELLPLSPREG